MKTFKTKAIYKSKTPEETIAQIREILSCCGIKTKEKYLHQTASDTHAAELYLDDPGIGGLRIAANGKGMTKSYALASAYGEFMERIQCGALLYQYQSEAFERGDVSFKWAPDEIVRSAKECLTDCGNLIKAVFGFSDESFEGFSKSIAEKELICLPFRDVFEDREVYLPYDSLFPFVTSNGMCAGNDPEEAMAQGISELYERDALMRIYRDNPGMPCLSKEQFADTEILKHLRCLEDKGYSADIMDCSMGMDYPVVGLRVIGPEGLYLSLGGDPNPVVALERCLTEMFQLTDESRMKKRASKDNCGTRAACRNIFETSYYHYQMLRSRRLGSGEKPDNIYNLRGIISESYRWDEKDNSYDYLVRLTKELGYHLLVRDCSYLGFPAYITMIPEIVLGDYLDDALISDIAGIFTGDIPARKAEHYEILLPVLKELEERHIRFKEKAGINRQTK